MLSDRSGRSGLAFHPMMANSALGMLQGVFCSGPNSRRLSADFALLATVTSVLGLFVISPATLEYFGVSYITPGGSVFSKFHPSTLVAVAALVLRCLSTQRPLHTGWELLVRDTGVLVLMIAVFVASVDAALFTRTPVTPLIDTFVLPIVVYVLLRDLNPAIVRLLALALIGFFCLNAAVALFESVAHFHLVQLPVPEGVSSDPTRGDAIFDWRAELALDWRATALMGHPLANGMIVSSFALALIVPGSGWLSPWIKGPTFLLQFASLFAFGARVALVLTIVFAIVLFFKTCADAVRNGARLKPLHASLALVVLAGAFGIGILLYDAGFFDPMIGRFTSDSGSAQTRTTMLQLLQPISWGDLILGPNQEVVQTWQRLYGLEFGIESSWLGLALTYGLVVTILLVGGLLAFSWSIVRASGRGAALILVSFFIVVSGMASLSGKTTAFAMTIILVLAFVRKDERTLPLRSMFSVKTV